MNKFSGLEMANEALLFHVSKYMGQKEIPGPKSNWWILQMIKSYNGGVFDWASDDGEIAWCSIFLHLVALDACAIIDPRTNKGATALARSWRYSGNEVPLDSLVLPGDVGIFSRGSNWGHVGVIQSIVDQSVYLLGGNQNNAVNQMVYKRSRLLYVRRLYLEPQTIDDIGNII